MVSIGGRVYRIKAAKGSKVTALIRYTARMTRMASIQMNSGEDVQANLKQATALIRQAADEGAEFVLLPEFFPLLSDDAQAKVQLKEKLGSGPLQDFLAQQATDNRIWLMGGTLSIDCGEPQRIYNTCILYTPEGIISHSYNKIHLFDVSVERDETYNESSSIAPGNELVVADTPLGHFGMTVCYDLRFPEMYRRLLDMGATIFTVPAAFTYATGKRHWQLLLQARAVENLCFVIASNQTGTNTPTRRTWGHSMIIDPWGEVLASVEAGPGIAAADINLNRLRELRHSFPALDHRTPRITNPRTNNP